MYAEITSASNTFGLLITIASAVLVGFANFLLIELPAKRGRFPSPATDHLVFPWMALMAAGYGVFELRYVLFRANQPTLDYWILGIYVVTIAVIVVSRLFALRRMCLTGG